MSEVCANQSIFITVGASSGRFGLWRRKGMLVQFNQYYPYTHLKETPVKNYQLIFLNYCPNVTNLTSGTYFIYLFPAQNFKSFIFLVCYHKPLNKTKEKKKVFFSNTQLLPLFHRNVKTYCCLLIYHASLYDCPSKCCSHSQPKLSTKRHKQYMVRNHQYGYPNNYSFFLLKFLDT